MKNIKEGWRRFTWVASVTTSLMIYIYGATNQVSFNKYPFLWMEVSKGELIAFSVIFLISIFVVIKLIGWVIEGFSLMPTENIKSKMKWRKLFYVCISVIIVLGIIAIMFSYINNVNKEPSAPKGMIPEGYSVVELPIPEGYSLVATKASIQNLCNISLSSSPKDVKFNLGESRYTIWPSGAKPVEEKINETWIYINENHKCYIKFKDKKIHAIYRLQLKSKGFTPYLYGVNYGDSTEIIKKILGEPSTIVFSDDDLIRLYLYENLEIFFLLKNNKVFISGAFNNELGQLDILDIVLEEKQTNILDLVLEKK